MRAALVRAIAVLGMTLAVAGCGASAHDLVQAKVEQFAQAAANRDYKTLCTNVLAPALVRHLTANGISCEQAMDVALGGVRNPTLSIGKIAVRGKTASAITLSTAAGQQASLEAIELVNTSSGWRVASLGSPLAK